MDDEFKRAYAEAYPDRLPEYVAGRYQHLCPNGPPVWIKHGERCQICVVAEMELGHHGPKDRDRK